MGERIREMGQARLLIVEDERIMAEDLKARLETMGFRVVGIAVSGQQALELAELERPDPGHHGYPDQGTHERHRDRPNSAGPF